jgi:hypothetical protein
VSRSARPEIRNPLLALPASQALGTLPADSRQKLSEAFIALCRDANDRAEKAWRRSKAPMAAYWKAVAIYAKHAARAIKRANT